MYATDFEKFTSTISDLCIAMNRPCSDDLVRVFWDDLKTHPLSEIQGRAKYLRAAGRRNFTSHDLRPERPAAPIPSTYVPPPFNFDYLHRFGQRCLLKFTLTYGPFEASSMQAMVSEKTRLLDNFREIAKEEELTADEVRETLFAGFRKHMGVAS